MFKSMMKRSWLSVTRKPSRTIILMLILFAMANLVLATISIKGSVNESMEYAKSSLGGTVYLQADMEKIRAQMESEFQSGDRASGERLQIERPEISAEMVESIADSDYVKDYTYSLNGLGKAESFEPVETETIGRGGMMGGGMSFNISGGEDSITGDVSVMGVNSYAFIDGVQNGTISLESGTYFDESTDDGAIISYDLAVANDLEVGDTIKIQNISTKEYVELEIIGIYDVSEDGFYANSIYMNVATAAKFLSEDEYSDGNYSVSGVQFFMANAEYADAFMEEVQEKYPDLEGDGLALSIDDSAYQQMVGPIESVGSFANTIFWIVVVASVVIISLMVTINVKDRRYEMGVLLSLGATKLNVLGQIATELIVVGTVAFALSMGTGTALAGVMSQGLLDSQIAASEAESEQNFGRPGTAVGGRTQGGGMMGGGMIFNMGGSAGRSDVEVIDEIDVSASPSDYAVLFGIGYLVIIISLVVPASNVLRYEPKTILTGKE